MTSPATEPDLSGLISPLLACLVTAAVSSQPPPALLPLLTPVLSQRVQLLSEGDGVPGSWLQLLSWDDMEGQQLSSVVRESSLEPHPVSGEVEFQLEGAVVFRRADRDTLQARIQLKEPCLKTIYYWCSGGEHEAGAWKLNSLSVGRAVHADDTHWYPSIPMADQAPAAAPATTPDADDDYWDQYQSKVEQTSSRESPSGRTAKGTSADDGRLWAEDVGRADEACYAQYGEVQPALDDPSSYRSHLLKTFSRESPSRPTARGTSADDGRLWADEACYAQYGKVQPALDYPSSFQPDGQPGLPDKDGRYGGQRASTSVEPHRAPEDILGHASSSAAARFDRLTSTDEANPTTSATCVNNTDTYTAIQKQFKDHIEQTLRTLHLQASTLGIGAFDFGDIVKEEMQWLDGR